MSSQNVTRYWQVALLEKQNARDSIFTQLFFPTPYQEQNNADYKQDKAPQCLVLEHKHC